MQHQNKRNDQQDIAIIGMACRFPGADNVTTFWNSLLQKKNVLSEIPVDRWDKDTYYSPDLFAPGKMISKKGGFVENIDTFDAEFFGISEKEASYMDPQQRILLETAWEAFEHAGLDPQQLAGTNAGVFIGSCNHDFSVLLWPRSDSLYAATGTGNSLAANRIAYTYKFNGPSIAVDTACSSSLSAVHLACQSLRSGECSFALVGGSSIMLLPNVTSSLSKAGMISANGRCLPFSDQADGYIRSEGAAMLALKPLATAIADGNLVIATICGSAINHNGETNGLTAPNPRAQLNLLQSAYHTAQIDPAEVDYVEAAATGAKLGDVMEVKTIMDFYLSGRDTQHNPLAVSSLKSMMGHLEGVGGIAALIKTALAIRHGLIPAGEHGDALNSLIDVKDKFIYFPVQNVEWPVRKVSPRLAGVSSFGFGGSNAHVILRQADNDRQIPEITYPSKMLLPLSAVSWPALRDLFKRYYECVNESTDVKALCHSAAVYRVQFKKRYAFLFSSQEDLQRQLARVIEFNEPMPNGHASTSEIALYLGDEALISEIDFSILCKEYAALREIFAQINQHMNMAESEKESYKWVTIFIQQLSLALWLQKLLPHTKAYIVEGFGELLALVLTGEISIAQSIQLFLAGTKNPDMTARGQKTLPIYYYDKAWADAHGQPMMAWWRNLCKDRYQAQLRIFKKCALLGVTGFGSMASALAKDFKGRCFSLKSAREFPELLKNLYMMGIHFDWRAYLLHAPHIDAHLPHYPFQRKRLWPDELRQDNSSVDISRDSSMLMSLQKDLRGKKLDLPFSNEQRYEYYLDSQRSDLLTQHKILDHCVVSASTQILMCVCSLIDKNEYAALRLHNINFPIPLLLDKQIIRRAQVIIVPEAQYRGHCMLVAQQGDDWQETLSADYEMLPTQCFDAQLSSAAKLLNPPDEFNRHTYNTFYQSLELKGYQFGEEYRWPLLLQPNFCVSESFHWVRKPQSLSAQHCYPYHPGLLNTAFLTVDTHITGETTPDMLTVPVSIQQMDINLQQTNADTFVVLGAGHGCMEIFTQDRQLLVSIKDFSCKQVAREKLLNMWANVPNSGLSHQTLVTGTLPEQLIQLISAVLGQSYTRDTLTQPLNTLGFDSLKAMELRSILHRKFSYDLPLTAILSGMSGATLLSYLSDRNGMDDKTMGEEVIDFSRSNVQEEMVEVEL